ncbi:PREDICTED: endonuclease V, partial [Myotis brandtii]|uniref:endonuclease V n=1 Tax=Myotis brandtii TaxID=109478 RepID=UPI000704022B
SARREQALLKARVVDQDTEAWQRDPAFAGLQRVGGVDVSFVKGDSVRACASLVVLSYPELEVLYEDSRLVHLTAPYLSGFLAFREVPFLVDAVQRLQEKEPSLVPSLWLFQVLLVDGNGVLHPRGDPAPERRWGGLREGGLPGCRPPPSRALTTPLCLAGTPHTRNGAPDSLSLGSSWRTGHVSVRAALRLRGAVGRDPAFPALRSHDRSTKPLYVSVGHKMSLEAAGGGSQAAPWPWLQGPVLRPPTCVTGTAPTAELAPCAGGAGPVASGADIRSRDYIRRTLGGPRPPAPGQERPLGVTEWWPPGDLSTQSLGSVKDLRRGLPGGVALRPRQVSERKAGMGDSGPAATATRGRGLGQAPPLGSAAAGTWGGGALSEPQARGGCPGHILPHTAPPKAGAARSPTPLQLEVGL